MLHQRSHSREVPYDLGVLHIGRVSPIVRLKRPDYRAICNTGIDPSWDSLHLACTPCVRTFWVMKVTWDIISLTISVWGGKKLQPDSNAICLLSHTYECLVELLPRCVALYLVFLCSIIAHVTLGQRPMCLLCLSTCIEIDRCGDQCRLRGLGFNPSKGEGQVHLVSMTFFVMTHIQAFIQRCRCTFWHNVY